MFCKESNFEVFERVMVEAHQWRRFVSCRIAFELSPWLAERPANWKARVNTLLPAKELDRVRGSKVWPIQRPIRG
jgi:hypothetical protein